MKEFVTQHPWMTLILGLAAIGAVRAIVSPAPVLAMSTVPPPVVTKPPPSAQAAAGLVGVSIFTPYVQPSVRPAHG